MSDVSVASKTTGCVSKRAWSEMAKSATISSRSSKRFCIATPSTSKTVVELCKKVETKKIESENEKEKEKEKTSWDRSCAKGEEPKRTSAETEHSSKCSASSSQGVHVASPLLPPCRSVKCLFTLSANPQQQLTPRFGDEKLFFPDPDTDTHAGVQAIPQKPADTTPGPNPHPDTKACLKLNMSLSLNLSLGLKSIEGPNGKEIKEACVRGLRPRVLFRSPTEPGTIASETRDPLPDVEGRSSPRKRQTTVGPLHSCSAQKHESEDEDEDVDQQHAKDETRIRAADTGRSTCEQRKKKTKSRVFFRIKQSSRILPPPAIPKFELRPESLQTPPCKPIQPQTDSPTQAGGSQQVDANLPTAPWAP
jgi:hypothetical protein